MKKPKSLFRIGLVTLLLVISSSLVYKFTTEAGTLAGTYLYFSRIQSAVNGVTPDLVEIVLSVNTSQNFPGASTIKIEFPDAEDSQWCRTTGALTTTAVTTSVVDGSANWDITATIPGTLTATCTPGGAGTLDTISITGVGPLTAGTTYGVKLANGVGHIGTANTSGLHQVSVTVSQGTTIDSKSFKLTTIADDTVEVLATVSDIPTVTCSISAATVNLGTLYPGGAYASASHTISVESSAVGGFYWAAYGEGNSTDNDSALTKIDAPYSAILSAPNGRIDLTSAAVLSGFGISINGTAGGSVPTDFNHTPIGGFGTLDRGVSGAKLIWYKQSASAPISATVAYGAKAGTANLAGSYKELVTFVCGGYY